MRNQIKIEVKSPCKENFNDFTPTKKGGFCQTCDKEVIDFTRMNTDEIIEFFRTNQSKNTCGRFKSKHLNSTLSGNLKAKKGILKRLSFTLIAMFSLSKIEAQVTQKLNMFSSSSNSKMLASINENTIYVQGNVNDGELPLPGVNVLLADTLIGTTTDFDGNFTFPKKLKKGDILVFSYFGMNSKKIEVTKESNELNISLDINLELDEVIIVGKVATKGVYKSKKN